MSRPAALLAALAVVPFAACKGTTTTKRSAPEPEPSTTATEPRTTPDDGRLFLVARPQVTTMPVPARFTAPLPTTVAELAARDRLPPETMLRAGLARGDESVRERFEIAVHRAADRGAIPDELRAYYIGLFGYRTSETACAWLVAQVPPARAAVASVLLPALAKCDDDASLKALLDAGAPGELVMEWGFQPGAEAPIPADDRILTAALDAARSEDTFVVRKIGFVLARLGDGAVPAVLQLQARLSDPERRAWVALGLLRAASPAAQVLGRQACKHPAVANDPMCRPDEPVPGDAGKGDPTKRSLDAQIEYGFDGDELVQRFPRAEVIAALSRCATDAARADHRRASCLHDLAILDRAAAATLSRSLGGAGEDVRRLAAELVRYPDAAALERRLDALGLTALQPPAVSPQHPRVTVADAIAHRGRQHWFDVETGQFPNEHDELMGELAGLVAPALDGAVFEEVVPEDFEGGTYTLRAYVGGKRYQVRAENLGDWYDVGAVLGLMNAVLADRGSDQRFLVLETGDQTAIVVAGPAAGLRALVDEDVLRPAGAEDSMDAGKAFEDKVFRQLQEEGEEVERDVPISQ